MNKNVLTLIKFVPKYEYAKSIQDGKLYMNTIKYYKELEEKEIDLRQDKDEGICYNGQPNKNKLLINNIAIDSNDITSPIKISRNKDLDRNIYCMYSLYSYSNSISEKDLVIDEKIKEFGEDFLLITNVNEFFSRIDNKLNELNIGFTRGLVEYKNLNTYNSKVDPFIKNANFLYQKEYRILLHHYNEGPYILDIGDISDISIIGKTKDIFKMITIEKKC